MSLQIGRDNGGADAAASDVEDARSRRPPAPGVPAWLDGDPEVQQYWREAEAERAALYLNTERERRAQWLEGEVTWEASWREGVSDNYRRTNLFEEFLIKIFRLTLRNAARTYQLITAMALLMFVVGVGLFVYAVIYATVGDVKQYSLLFAGMGATTFVAIWVIEPFDRAQAALSNLMQAELCFTSTWEEVKLWKAYPGPPDPASDPTKLAKATAQIDLATRRGMERLEKFVEPKQRRPWWARVGGDQEQQSGESGGGAQQRPQHADEHAPN